MILIVDDDPSVLASLSLLLKQAGYASHAVAGPADAQALARGASVRAGPAGHELHPADHGRRRAGAAGRDPAAHPHVARRADHGLGIDRPRRPRDEGRRQRLHHQAVDQRADPADRPHRAGAVGRAAGAATSPLDREDLDAAFDFGDLVGEDPAC